MKHKFTTDQTPQHHRMLNQLLNKGSVSCTAVFLNLSGTKEPSPKLSHIITITQSRLHANYNIECIGLTRLDRQRNPEIRNSLKVDNIVEDIKQYQRRWIDHLERMDRSRLPRLAFQYQPRGWRERGRPRARWKDQEHLELQRNRS
jgi:hypothetical protein